DDVGDDVDEDDDDEEDQPWTDDDPDGLYKAAYEDMVYRDSTDDGFDADMIDEFTPGSEFELEEEAERLSQRLDFLATVARLWRHVAIAWKIDAATHPDRYQLHENWCQQAMSRYDQLMELAEAVHRYPIVQPTASNESMVEADRQRMIKDSLLEHIIATCVETANAGRLILAASSPASDPAAHEESEC